MYQIYVHEGFKNVIRKIIKFILLNIIALPLKHFKLLCCKVKEINNRLSFTRSVQNVSDLVLEKHYLLVYFF